MRYSDLAAPLLALAETAGVPLSTDASGASAPMPPTVDERIETGLTAQRIAITGQNTPPPPMGWAMSNNRSARRLDALEPQVAQALVQVESLADVVKDGLEDIGTKFDLLNTQRQLDLSAFQVERTRNDLQDAKDALQDAAIAELQAQDELTAALDELQSAQIEQNRLDTLALSVRQTATEQRLAADELDIAALKASDASQTAQQQKQATAIAALQAQQLADETRDEANRQLALAAQARADQALAAAITAQATADQAKADAKAAKDLAVAAQARADQAEANAQAAKTAAATAQTAANTAQAGVTAANARIDAVVANVATVQAAATAAQTTATNAQAAVAALADKGRVILGVATPASAGLLGIGGTMSVNLSWTKAFPGTNYAGSFLRTSGGSAAMGVSLTNKTPTSCTLVLTLTGTVSLAVPAGTGDVVLTYAA